MSRQHKTAIAIAAACLAILLFGFTVMIAVRENSDAGKLKGVTEAGPCRLHGIHNAECKKQARLIARACLADKQCRALLKAKGVLPKRSGHKNSQGVVLRSGSSAPRPTGPSQGGSTGSGGSTPLPIPSLPNVPQITVPQFP